MATPEQALKITNNSGKDIAIVLYLDQSQTSCSQSVVAASQDIEMLKTNAGSYVIKNSETTTVTLDRTYKPGGDVQGAVADYNLQVSESNWVYPLCNIAVSQEPGIGYKDQVITTSSLDGMKQAFAFYQNVTAYPDSQLASDYFDFLDDLKESALEQATGTPESASGITANIDSSFATFFKNYSDYQSVALPDVVAVDNYYRSLPSLWAQYNDSQVYYLYSSDGNTSLFNGTLSIKKTGSIDISKVNGGYTSTFAPASDPTNDNSVAVDSSKAQPLAYEDGFFSGDTTGGPVTLHGMFMLRQSVTNDSKDSSIMFIMVGKLGNDPCLAFDRPQVDTKVVEKVIALGGQDDNQDEDFWHRLIDPKTSQDLGITIATFLGGILLIPFSAFVIYKIYKYVQNRAKVKEWLSKNGLDAKWNEMTAAQREHWNEQMKKGVPDGSPVKEINIRSLPEYKAAFQNKLRANDLILSLEKQAECMDTFLTYSSKFSSTYTKTLQDIQGKINTSIEKLNNSSPRDLDANLKTELGNWSRTQGTIMRIHTDVNHLMTKDSQTIVDQSQQTSEAIYDSIQDSLKNEEKLKGEKDPKIDKEFDPFE